MHSTRLQPSCQPQFHQHAVRDRPLQRRVCETKKYNEKQPKIHSSNTVRRSEQNVPYDVETFMKIENSHRKKKTTTMFAEKKKKEGAK